VNMKIFLDENIPRSFAIELRNIGFETQHVANVGLTGATDKDIATYAKKQKSILITKDLEFGSFILYPKGTHYGLIIIRLPNNFTPDKVLKILKNFLVNIGENNLIGKIVVLEVGRYRIRDAL